MSYYKPPLNTQFRIAKSWVFMLCLLSIFTFIKLYSSAYTSEFPYFTVIGDDATIAFSILSTFYTLLCGAMLYVYLSRAAKFNKIIKGEYLASWLLEGEEWLAFKESELDEETTRRFIVGIAVGSLFALIGLGVVIFDNSKTSIYFLEIMLVIASLFFGIALFQRFFTKKNLHIDYGLMYLNQDALVYNNYMHLFTGFSTRIESMEIFEDSTAAHLGVSYSYPVRHGRNTRTVVVPIPIAEVERFRELVNIILNKDQNQLSKFNKIDLLARRVDTSEIKSFSIAIAITALSSIIFSAIAGYGIVQYQLKQYKQGIAEYKQRQENEKTDIIQFNNQIYSKMSESAKDYRKYSGFAWDYTFTTDNNDYIFPELLEDGSLLIGSDKKDGNLEIRKIDANGRELWTKYYTRKVNDEYFETYQLLNLGKDIAVLSAPQLPDNSDLVQLSLVLIDTSGKVQSNKLISIDSNGHLSNHKFLQRDDNSFIYEAWNESNNNIFVAVINKNGTIESTSQIRADIDNPGSLDINRTSMDLAHTPYGIIQVNTDSIYFYNYYGKISKTFKTPFSSENYQNLTTTNKGNILFFNKSDVNDLESELLYSKAYQMSTNRTKKRTNDSAAIDILNYNGEQVNKYAFNIRRNFGEYFFGLNEEKALIVANSAINRSEFTKILLGIYDFKKQEFEQQILGINHTYCDLLFAKTDGNILYAIIKATDFYTKDNGKCIAIKFKVQ